jgi:hypothetical protein
MALGNVAYDWHPSVFRVGVAHDFGCGTALLQFAPVDLSPLEAGGLVEWEFIAEDVRELTPELIEGDDRWFHFSPAVTSASLAGLSAWRSSRAAASASTTST